MATQKVGQLI